MFQTRPLKGNFEMFPWFAKKLYAKGKLVFDYRQLRAEDVHKRTGKGELAIVGVNEIFTEYGKVVSKCH